MKSFKCTTLLIAATLLLSGCLKTRTQMHGDADASAEPNSATKKTPANYEMEEIKNEVTRLNGKVEELDHEQRSSRSADLRSSIANLETRVVELEKNQVLILTELKDIKDNQTAKPAPAAPHTNQTVKSLLQEGNALLAEKNFEGAAEKFRAVIAKKPKPAESAEAQFGLGEGEYAQKNYKKAIVEYSKVQEIFSKSPKTPASLYKIGLCFQKLNMQKESRDFFSELTERYPNSPEAKKARGKSKDNS